MAHDDKEDKSPKVTETRGKPADLVDVITGNEKDGIETDEAGDKVKITEEKK